MRKNTIIHTANRMEGIMVQNMAKTTVVFPQEFKKEVDAFRNELGISLSALLIKAFTEYKNKLEEERWIKAFKHADEIGLYKNDPELKEWAEFVGDDFIADSEEDFNI